MSPGSFWQIKQFCHIFTPVDQLFLQYPALKLTYNVQWALYCVQHYDICVSTGWLHKVQWVLCTAFWTMDMTGLYACLCEAVCDVTTVPSRLKSLSELKTLRFCSAVDQSILEQARPFPSPSALTDQDITQCTVFLAGICIGLPKKTCYLQTLLFQPQSLRENGDISALFGVVSVVKQFSVAKKNVNCIPFALLFWKNIFLMHWQVWTEITMLFEAKNGNSSHKFALKKKRQH